MTELGDLLHHLGPLRGRAFARGAIWLAMIGLLIGLGCSSSPSSATGGHGGSGVTSSQAASSQAASSSSTSGSSGASGGSSTSSSSTTSSSGTGGSSTSSSSTGAGGADGGTGGSGFVPPAGTAEYPAEVEPNNIEAQANPLAAGTLGFTASIWPLGDVDDFSFMVTAKETNVTVKTSDGNGGCPVGAQTLVRVYDANEDVYATFDGVKGCADLTPASAPGLGNLGPGLYYVHVESAALAVIPYYVLDIHVATPSCGDGIVQVETGEQCDHGATNGAPSDGCSATCRILSGSYVNETEPNDTTSMANSLVGYAGGVGEIAPVGDVDVYAFDVTVADSSVVATIGDGFGGCPLAFDSKLSLLSSSGTVLVTDEGGGVSPCSSISPSQYVSAGNLPVGTYYLEVQRITAATQQYYVLGVTVTPPSCGDGIVETGEQCDPGPMMVPGCSATCQLTGDFIPETEPNNTLATANPLGAHAGFTASIEPVGDVDFFSFQVPGPASSVFLQTSDGIGGCPVGFDSLLTLFGPSGQMILQDDNGGVSLCSKITPALYPQASKLAAGTYWAEVQFKGNMSAQPLYVVTLAVAAAGCGDGLVEPGEECDDGPLNGAAGDGCNATCQSLAPWESEPNGSTATATPQWPGYDTWKGAITPVGDHDYYSFTLATKGTVTLTTHDQNKPTDCSSDTFLTLLDSGGSLVASDDDSGPGPGYPGWGKCSKISAVPLNPGTYYAWVQCALDLRVIPEYQLDLLVQ